MVKQIQRGGGHDRPRPLFELPRCGSEEGEVKPGAVGVEE